MRIIIVSPKNKTLYNFRGPLIKELVRLNHDVLCIGPNSDHVDKVLELGVDFKICELKKDSISIISDFMYIHKLRKIIKRYNPNVLLAYTIKPILYSNIALKTLKKNIKKFYMITGLGRAFIGNTFRKRIMRSIINVLYKSALKNCNKVFFQNDSDIEYFLEKNYILKKQIVKTLGSGVDLNKFPFSSLPKENRFIMISRLIQEKGVIEYCEAAALVKNKFPKTMFYLVGGFDTSSGRIKESELKKYINLGIIEYIGEVDDVIPFLSKAKVFVLPTYYKEGFPRSILEALSMGRPVITTDWLDNKMVIEENSCGTIVKIRDVESLVDAMIDLIQNPDKVQDIHFNIKNFRKNIDVNLINKEVIDNLLKD